MGPLHIASDNGHTDIVRLLLENKADPNIRDDVSKFNDTFTGTHK